MCGNAVYVLLCCFCSQTLTNHNEPKKLLNGYISDCVTSYEQMFLYFKGIDLHMDGEDILYVCMKDM